MIKVSDWRDKSVLELKKELLALLKEQFNLRMQRGPKPIPRQHLFKQVRRDIARIKTLLKEKEGKV